MKTSKGVQVTPYRFDTQVKHSIMGLHGIGGSASSFAPQQAIASEQLNFLAWDMPGYQGSPLLSITTFESLARRLLDNRRVEARQGSPTWTFHWRHGRA
jgi:pimeloyl-ACP methyl ester carboxylesterase